MGWFSSLAIPTPSHRHVTHPETFDMLAEAGQARHKLHNMAAPIEPPQDSVDGAAA
jgi:hypothetical protein